MAACIRPWCAQQIVTQPASVDDYPQFTHEEIERGGVTGPASHGQQVEALGFSLFNIIFLPTLGPPLGSYWHQQPSHQKP